MVESRLKHFPIAWFSTVMGLCGFSIAWNRAEHYFTSGFCVSSLFLGLTTLLFIALIIFFSIKMFRYPDEVINELRHPVKHAFVPTVAISFLLLSAAYLQREPDFSFWLWTIGTSLQSILSFYVLSSWIWHDRYEITHLSPAWFIPVVGNIIVPIAGVSHAPIEISWFFFSLGIFFWPILTSIIFYRLVFHPQLPDRLLPTLFIFIAPPAVGCISWISLNGTVGAFGQFLFSISLAFTILLLSQMNHFRKIKFFLSWWAYSFPLAALTIASFIMARETSSHFYLPVAFALLSLLTLLIAMLIVRTVVAVYRKEICIPGH